MSDDGKQYTITGHDSSFSLNKSYTMGVMEVPGLKTNQTRSTYFTTSVLLEWAEAIVEAYGENEAVEIMFTPEKPIIARQINPDGGESKLGLGAAPRLDQDSYAELHEDD